MYFFGLTRYSRSIMVPTMYFFGLTMQSKSVLVPTLYFFGLTRSSKRCFKFLLSTMYFSAALILAPTPGGVCMNLQIDSLHLGRGKCGAHN